MIRDTKIYRLFLKVSKTISHVTNTALLTIVYFVGVGLTSALGKAFGKKFLETETIDENTYWSEYGEKKSKESYYRTF